MRRKTTNLTLKKTNTSSGSKIVKQQRCLQYETVRLVAKFHMQRYFSCIYDVRHKGVQADWRSLTYGRAPNVIDIS